MNGITGIEVSENVALVSFQKIPHDLALLADVFGRFSGEGIVIDMISQTSPIGGSVSVSFSCPEKDIIKVTRISKSLGDAAVKPMIRAGNCKLRLYGEEMRDAPGVFARVIGRLAETSAELLQVTTSEVEISLLLPAAHADDAAAAIKEEFSLQ